MKNHIFNVLKIFIPLAVVASVMAALIYVSVQQSYRQNANDPQIQLAQDAANRLAAGDVPASVVPRTTPVEISQSLAPYIFVAESNGTVLESSAVLNNQVPQIPIGLYGEASARGGQYRVTWQPEAGVRQALVIQAVPNSDRFVVSGRSLKEVERRINILGWLVLCAWAAAIIVSLILLIALEALSSYRAD